ncbi:cytochrome c oxidase assembly protein [Oceanicola granulosus HTCC2516]|uniref:Heme A synthase n=1 Tax=Oceanicola granulosus (strain ATCC BAA-861 / DSM 15982 / KCTC 12143 / HTCC2516) TaxID=314256 RepID=Q2CHZ6_OCEGH|nr:heme A synthase [Oceanicola granulosus]EAR52148.1 cytochrome c oxidase assembly protein [Oceanicola granulosus HTCC2516]
MADKPRAIFEEVKPGEPVRGRAPVTGGIDRGGQGARGLVRVWLMVLFALVMVMIVVGGMTRLTDSGLSITEWAPISGALPPMNAADWEREFAAYQQTTEYREQNAGMSLAEFKSIYWWEWGHRQLGRVIGLVWALGFAGLLVAGKMPRGWTGRLLVLGALGGLQGAVGWWMVASGLEEGMFDVASYRLAVHLGLAFAIFGLIAWFCFRLGRPSADLLQARRAGEPKLFSMSTGLMHAAFLQILLGALVAGIDAGRNYPSWPLMDGGLVPADVFGLEPLWRNFFENPGLVQFMHRMVGYLVFAFGIVVWLRARRSGNHATRFAFNAVLAMLLVQMALGVLTVLYAAPVTLAILHQLGAVLLWVLILRGRFLARYPLPQSVRGARR